MMGLCITGGCVKLWACLTGVLLRFWHLINWELSFSVTASLGFSDAVL